MKPAWLLLLAVLMAGCATRLYSPKTGKLMATLPADMDAVYLKGGGMTFYAIGVNHSAVIAAGFAGGAQLTNAIAAAALGAMGKGVPAATLAGAQVIHAAVIQPQQHKQYAQKYRPR